MFLRGGGVFGRAAGRHAMRAHVIAGAVAAALLLDANLALLVRLPHAGALRVRLLLQHLLGVFGELPLLGSVNAAVPEREKRGEDTPHKHVDRALTACGGEWCTRAGRIADLGSAIV